MKRFLIATILLLSPSVVFAMADLQILQADVRFSKDPLIAGDTVRIYATVRNDGDEDVSGYVTFYQGPTVIATSQVISLLAGGNPEEVFVDFVVPTGDFNIQAQIEGTEPADENPNNNVTITPVIEPVIDDDRDGVPNETDNCPSTANGDQTNADTDAFGNACDADDDNDGVSDDVEAEVGTDATLADSDGDGVGDQEDAYPSDVGRQKVEEVVKVEKVEEVREEPRRREVLRQVITEVVEKLKTEKEGLEGTGGLEGTRGEAQNVEVQDSDLAFAANVLFTYEREAWNRYAFIALGVDDPETVYAWDFGDGVTSSKTEVEHTYTSPGVYKVALTRTSGDGETLTESTTIAVPFMSLGNPIVATAVAVLGLLLAAGAYLLVGVLRKKA